MKTLIKTYYKEPQIDVDNIMKTLFIEQKKFTWTDICLIPIVGMSVLLVIFGTFLFDLNINFLSTGISIYSALGGVVFMIFNIIVGMIIFILEHYMFLVGFSMMLFFLQNIQIYLINKHPMLSH